MRQVCTSAGITSMLRESQTSLNLPDAPFAENGGGGRCCKNDSVSAGPQNVGEMTVRALASNRSFLYFGAVRFFCTARLPVGCGFYALP
jgi:hypothetical protein